MDIKERWKDTYFLSQNFTLKDVEDLIEHITPWLEGMELKFSWDYSVNEMELSSFIEITMCNMYEVVNPEYKNEYELYPKQLDFESLWDVIAETHIDNYVGKGEKIWELVRDKILEISREVLI